MRRFNRVITAALCSTICSAMLMPAAYAQTAQSDEDSGDEPIIVTAHGCAGHSVGRDRRRT